MKGRASLNEQLAFAPRAADPVEFPYMNHRRMGTVLRNEAFDKAAHEAVAMADQAARDFEIERRLAKMGRCDD
jgi:hypothetical protein